MPALAHRSIDRVPQDAPMRMTRQAPLWPVPAAIALVLAGAAHLALALAIHAGDVPACVPYLDGCASISRAARHGLANHLFRLLVLPCAVLLGVHWWLSARWLRARDASPGALGALGTVSAIALGVYAAFLGTDGEIYRYLRRYGVIVFFGASYVAQLVFLAAAVRVHALDRRIRSRMQLLCLAMLAIGVVHVAAMGLFGGTAFQDRLENALEWQIGLLLVLWFVQHAQVWRRDGYALATGIARPDRRS